MQLLCMRHGHADAGDATTGDAGRTLSVRGRQQVQEVATALAAAGARPDRVVSSPLVRTRQTAEIVADALNVAAIDVDGSLAYTSPAAEAQRYLETLACPSALAVGHMPTLPETIYLLTGRELSAMATAQVVCIEDGRVRWTLAPGDTAPRKL